MTVDKVRQFLKTINISGPILRDEPMSLHTTFKAGGPAELFFIPRDKEDLTAALRGARNAGIPVFILGGGANILVSDRGFRGLVADLSSFNAVRIEGALLSAGAGLPVSTASERAAEAGLGGLDFIYSMPGSVGGAVWMNARCYESSVADVLESVLFLDDELNPRTLKRGGPLFVSDFGYKKSPFQGRSWIIIETVFRLRHEDKAAIKERMERVRLDRTNKGHFIAPCAGSVFKNNRDFGHPSGVLIDRLGLRGFSLGEARISPLHGNIIINTGNASASDIKQLMDLMQERVRTEYGFNLEPEVLLVGDWE
jgi:UDP-N-acetylmuramate dehydrogenase